MLGRVGKNTLEGWDSRDDCHYEEYPSSGQQLLTYNKTPLTQTLPIPQTSRACSSSSSLSGGVVRLQPSVPVLWWQQGQEMKQVPSASALMTTQLTTPTDSNLAWSLQENRAQTATPCGGPIGPLVSLPHDLQVHRMWPLCNALWLLRLCRPEETVPGQNSRPGEATWVRKDNSLHLAGLPLPRASSNV